MKKLKTSTPVHPVGTKGWATKRTGNVTKMEAEVLMSSEAQKEFGFSRDMMTKLLRSGTIPYTPDPLDKRIKWVKRRDVERIAARSLKLKRAVENGGSERRAG